MNKYIFAAPRLKTKTPCPCPSDSCNLFAESAHGSYAAYKLKNCRCEPCRDANAIYNRDLKKRQNMVDSGEVTRDDYGRLPRLDKGSNLDAPVKRNVSLNEIQTKLPVKNFFNDPNDPRHGTTNGYKVGCRCDPCRNADSEYKKQYKLDRLQEMQNDPDHKFHGTPNGYIIGCRCDPCRNADSEHHKQYKLDKLEEMQNDPDHKFHGTRNGYKVGCRCDDCTDANSEYKKQYRKNKKQSSMWYDKVNWYEL